MKTVFVYEAIDYCRLTGNPCPPGGCSRLYSQGEGTATKCEFKIKSEEMGKEVRDE